MSLIIKLLTYEEEEEDGVVLVEEEEGVVWVEVEEMGVVVEEEEVVEEEIL